VKEISLTQGYTALIDDEDFANVSSRKWRAQKVKGGHIYAVSGSHPRVLLLHRVLLGITDSNIDVDHKDRNGLNCQRANLRVCSAGENLGNQAKTRTYRGKPTSSRFKGVSKERGKWCAAFRYKRIGLFSSEEDAARAYDRAALEYYGPFALTNFLIEATA
jgi:hypothetical protein